MNKQIVENTLKKLSSLQKVTTVEDGGIVTISKDILQKFIKQIILRNGHFHYKQLPGLGLPIGSIFTHPENKNDYITVNYTVGLYNQMNIHLGRPYEALLYMWEENNLGLKVMELNKELEAAGIVNDTLKYWCDSAGLDGIDTPSDKYLSELKGIDNSNPLHEKITTLIEVISPYCGLGPKLKEIRDILGIKGVISTGKNYVTTSSPSSSGGADWYMWITETPEDVGVSSNNLGHLLFVKSPADNVLRIGGGEMKYGMFQFYIKPSLLAEIDEKIKPFVNEYQPVTSKNMDEIWKKFSDYKEAYNDQLSTIIDEVLIAYMDKNTIFGHQFDVVNNVLVFKEVQAAKDEHANLQFSGLLLETSDNYYLIK